MNNFIDKSNLKLLFFMLILASPLPLLFAQGNIVPPGLENTANQIKAVFTGPIVTVILVCCLAGCGIAYAFNKDNEKMKRNVIAIAIGIVLVGAAAGIVSAFFTAAGNG